MKNLIYIIIGTLIGSSLLAQGNLQSGPMLGYSEMREAAIWLQTKESAVVQIKYWIQDKPDNISFTEKYNTIKAEAFTATLIADNVEPGNTYRYAVLINEEVVDIAYETTFETQAIWKWRGDAPDFSFATGSCAYINEEAYDRPGKPYGSNYNIFTAIHKAEPNFMLWLGDNTYLREPDWNSWTGIIKRNTHTRSVEELQALLASTHHYAIWDDHDYGPNDSDRGWWNKNQTLKAFELFWANPSYGVGDVKGAFTQFQWYDVDFILLDNRFYRSPNKLKADNKTILGDAQKQWLKDALVSSNSSFKVIAMGGQFLNDAAVFELYSNNGFDKERQEIIDFIYEQNIRNVVFITGDRHHTELCLLDEPGKPRIIDLTVSALTSGPSKNVDPGNTLFVEGTYTHKHNFGLVSFTGSGEERTMNFEVIDNEGTSIWKKSFDME